MAFSSLRAQDDFGDTISAATFTYNPTATIQVGDLICLGWDLNTASVTVSSINDNSTQAGEANVYTANTPRSTTAHSFGTAYCLKASRSILTTDAITVTVSAVGTRRSGVLAAFVPGHGNAQFDQLAGVTADTTSPVDYAATNALRHGDSLLVTFGGWRGGAVGEGWDGHSTWSTLTGGHSNGTTSRSATNVAYILRIGSSAAVTISETYTSITNAHGEVLVFNDQAQGGVNFARRGAGPRFI